MHVSEKTDDVVVDLMALCLRIAVNSSADAREVTVRLRLGHGSASAGLLTTARRSPVTCGVAGVTRSGQSPEVRALQHRGTGYQVSAAPRCRIAEMAPGTRARTALVAASAMSAARTIYSVSPMVTL